MSEDGCVVAWTTVPPETDAARLARTLVETGLAACVTTHAPVTSWYRWEGAVEEASEQLLMIKTTRARVVPLLERLRQLHPYAVPEFVVVPVVGGNPAYLQWIRESTASSQG